MPGILGQLFVITVFVSSLLASVAYFISAQSKDELIQNNWRRIARMLFAVQAICVAGIVATLYYIIHEHRFEYHYAWEHSSMQLPMKYLLACFWEGQEGSFLLWMWWNMVLGALLIFRAGKKWEAPVLCVFMVVQCFLASMLLGIYFWDYKVGSSPFILLRDVMIGAPIFQRADYLSFIKDGNGLNPLLQNYWMVIHPPILFLGFASTLVPFAYSMAALWKKDFTGWINSVLPWTLFSGAVLGTGIMMGGAWAYESLTFGGYWAWDPVENASLVPWLILVAGIHTMLAFKKSGHSLRSTFLFFLLSFILVLYSTFLTRSGILGNSSVHAFTDLGMSGQLVFYLLALTIPAILLLAFNWKKIPAPEKEEAMGSREFWIFVGAGILFISAFQITLYTSIPVYSPFVNWLTGLFGNAKSISPPTEPIQTYNSYQLPVAVLILLLSSFSLYMKFRASDMKQFYRRMMVIFAVSVVLTVTVAWFGDLTYPTHVALLFASIFSVVANLFYLFIILRGKHRLYGPALAHLGFGILLLGILISSANKHTISLNYRGVDYGERMNNLELHTNQFMPKDSREHMGDYMSTYIGDSIAEPNHYYKVRFERMDTTKDVVLETFVLHPNAQINPKMGLISNPDTRHYWDHDIYTHVTTVPEKNNNEEPGEEKFKTDTLAKGDTIFTSNSFVILESVEKVDKSDKIKMVEGDLCVGAKLHIIPMEGKDYMAEPLYLIHDGMAKSINDKVSELGLIFRLKKILPEQNKVEIDVAEVKPEQDYIVMKAIVFPFINLVWLGTIMTVFGFLISLFRIFQKK
ncbi:MAG: cytochrome c biogenesis protein CcsA, partial [Bacteroidota bacterium]